MLMDMNSKIQIPIWVIS